MSEQHVVVREINWRSLCPWLAIFRTFSVATSLPVLLLATVGAVLTPVGWHAGEWLFVSEESLAEDAAFRRIVEQNRTWPSEPQYVPVPNGGAVPTTVREVLATTTNQAEPIFAAFVHPLARLFDARLSVTQAAYFLCGWLWMLGVWGFFGGAITRIAALRLGREERIGLGAALRHARRRFWSYVASPLFPLLAVILSGLPLWGLGALLRLDWAAPLVGAVWFLSLLGGLVMALFLLGLLFGWPLMWGTLSCEREGDPFEAFSRSFAYTFQRPLHYLFYALVATTYAAFCWLLAYHFTEAVIQLTDWAAALGAGPDRWQDIIRLRAGEGVGEGGLLYGSLLMAAAVGLVRSITVGLGFGLFWSLTAAIYLLLRQDADRTEMDEIFVDPEDRAYEVLPMPPRAAGTPGVTENASAGPPGASPAAQPADEPS